MYGYLYVFAASILFGISPTLSTLLQKSGWTNGAILLNNEIFGAFYLFLLIRNKHLDLRISKKEFAASFGLGGIAFWGTNILLQISYEFLPNPGIASMFHFIYPVFVMTLMAIFFRERITLLKLMCIVSSLCGIFLIANISKTFNQDVKFLVGILAAIASGATYAVYIVSNDKSPAKDVHPLILPFYVLSGGAIYNILYLLATCDFCLDLSGRNVVYALTVPLCSFSALVTIAEGIRRIGPTKAAVINTLEPVVAMITSMLVFRNTPLTAQTVCGGALILFSTGLIAVLNDSKKRPAVNARKDGIRKTSYKKSRRKSGKGEKEMRSNQSITTGRRFGCGWDERSM